MRFDDRRGDSSEMDCRDRPAHEGRSFFMIDISPGRR